jgi:hypothetical protein
MRGKRWNPELADYYYSDEDETDSDNESWYAAERDCDVTVSHRSECESDFDGRESDTGSRWSGDIQSADEMEDISGQREVNPDCPFSKDLGCCGYDDEDRAAIQEGSSSEGERSRERESRIVPRKRTRHSRDESDSEREWKTPSKDISGTEEELESGQSSATRSCVASESESDDESTSHLTGSGSTGVDQVNLTRSAARYPTTQEARGPSPSNFSTASFDYEYSSDADAQHTRKVHALSQCRILTLSDRHIDEEGDSYSDSYDYGYSYGDRYSERYSHGYRDRYSDRERHDHYDSPSDPRHTHKVLHNGKAHLLFPDVVTLRILNPQSSHPAANTGIENLCRAGRSCPDSGNYLLPRWCTEMLAGALAQCTGGWI